MGKGTNDSRAGCVGAQAEEDPDPGDDYPDGGAEGLLAAEAGVVADPDDVGEEGGQKESESDYQEDDCFPIGFHVRAFRLGAREFSLSGSS